MYLTPQDYETAAKNGITEETAYKRFYQLNWSKRRTVTQPQRKLNQYTEWVEIARQNGIRHNTFLNRIYRGWNKEDAATTRLQKGGRKRA